MMRHAIAIALVASGGCGSGTECTGMLASNTLAGGSGTIAVTDVHVTTNASAFVWNPAVPAQAVQHGVDFTFDFADSMNDQAYVVCGVDWSALSAPMASTTTTVCGLGVGIPDAGNVVWWSNTSTITTTITNVASTIDAQGNGTLTLAVDIAPTDIVVADEAHDATHTVHVELDALLGTATFTDQSCPSNGCGSAASVPVL